MKRLLTIITLSLLFIIPTIRSQAQSRQLFDGGMMVHTGYMHATIDTLGYEAKGMNFGMGGVLRFHIGKHFRIGGEGYVSTLRQMKNGSYIRTGCGGIVADAYWCIGRWQPYIGVTIGGGSTTTLLMFDGSANDWQAEVKTVFHKSPFFFVSPYIGVEFAITEAVHLTLKVDRQFPIKKPEMPSGVRFCLGFVFAH